MQIENLQCWRLDEKYKTIEKIPSELQSAAQVNSNSSSLLSEKGASIGPLRTDSGGLSFLCSTSSGQCGVVASGSISSATILGSSLKSLDCSSGVCSISFLSRYSNSVSIKCLGSKILRHSFYP